LITPLTSNAPERKPLTGGMGFTGSVFTVGSLASGALSGKS
jgi:hypothetical protein